MTRRIEIGSGEWKLTLSADLLLYFASNIYRATKSLSEEEKGRCGTKKETKNTCGKFVEKKTKREKTGSKVLDINI
jgi:hypothetical protein